MPSDRHGGSVEAARNPLTRPGGALGLLFRLACLALFAWSSTAVSAAGLAAAETETLYREGHALLDGYTGEGADLQRAYEIFSAIAAEDPRSDTGL